MFEETKARLRLPTPPFWKKLQKRTAQASAAFLTLTITMASIANYVPSFPAIMATVCGILTAFFGGIAAVSVLAVDDPQELAQPASVVPPVVLSPVVVAPVVPAAVTDTEPSTT